MYVRECMCTNVCMWVFGVFFAVKEAATAFAYASMHVCVCLCAKSR